MADKSVADQLRELGVKNANVLVRMAERGQLLALRCEMPQCYHHKGRGAFDPVGTPGNKWTPSRDHYPTLKSDGGKFVAENVRLSHSWCNKRDWGWRAQVRTQLAKGKSLADIAEFLNRKGVPPGPRHEPMDGRHGAQGLRVLVRVRRWVPLCAKHRSHCIQTAESLTALLHRQLEDLPAAVPVGYASRAWREER